MSRFLPLAIAFVVVLYAFIDVLLTRGSDTRTFPRWVWALVVILLPVLGAIGWFILGRPRRAAAGGPGRGRAPVAPDDDPAFLRELQDKTWSEQMRKRREGRPAAGGAAAAGAAGAASSGTPSPDAPAPEGGPDEESGTTGPAVDSGSPGPTD